MIFSAPNAPRKIAVGIEIFLAPSEGVWVSTPTLTVSLVAVGGRSFPFLDLAMLRG
jgi:hypothetical protein